MAWNSGTDDLARRDGNDHRGLRIFREYSLVGGNAYRRIIYHGAVVHSDNDSVCLDGKVHDPQRTDFIYRYLGGVKRAISEGIPVIGYQYWSLMDNFEWAEGYSPRFGLIYIDFETQERILKDSAYEYKKIIETNGDCI